MKDLITFSVRVPEDLHAKLRVIAAFRNATLNSVVNSALGTAVAQWEHKYGAVPKNPEVHQ